MEEQKTRALAIKDPDGMIVDCFLHKNRQEIMQYYGRIQWTIMASLGFHIVAVEITEDPTP